MPLVEVYNVPGVGRRLRRLASRPPTNQGKDEINDSLFSSLNTNPPVNLMPPIIGASSLLLGGAVSIVVPSTWNQMGNRNNRWFRDGVQIAGSEGLQVPKIIIAADQGHVLTLREQFNNLLGNPFVFSNDIAIPAGNPNQPANTVLPTITGITAVGQTITCNPGTWTGTPAPTITYQWARSQQPLPGETNPTYVTVPADVSQGITCRVTGTNQYGVSTVVTAQFVIPQP